MVNCGLGVPRDEMLRRISGEYLEMPGLKLTTEQAQRLWALDRDTCCDLLGELVASCFLTRSADGCYMRAADGAAANSRMRMARAALEPAAFAVKRVS